MRTAYALAMPLLLLACRADPKDADASDVDQDTVDGDGDGHPASQDCDDANAAINADATEVCDEVDNDCDGDIDEGVTVTVFSDADADGFGDPATATEACDAGDGQVAQGDDCDDTNDRVYPTAEELCDELDNDCDGAIDEDGLSTWYADTDGDGAGDPATAVEDCAPAEGWVPTGEDCDDDEPAAAPGLDERCDGIDNDCDGTVDGPASIDAATWYVDVDGDGYGDASVSEADCVQPPGFTDNPDDCDDADVDVSPAAAEVCDEVDNDCDGATDEDDAADAATWYADTDGDGHGDPASTAPGCEAPSGYVESGDDCDDSRSDVSPSASEMCDGATDEDCDGAIDEDDAADAPTWYADADSDGYGAGLSGTTAACTQPSGYEPADDDCDDTDATINPAATELCDAADNDCDGTIDEDDAADAATWYADTDTDGYGDATSTTLACSEPSAYSGDDTDCDDTDATVFPGSTETETPGDGVDQDCDGVDACTDLDCDGQPDLVVTTHYAGAYTASSFIYYADTGYIDADRVELPSSGAYEAQAEDLDGDGYQDIVIANYYDGSTRRIDSTVYWGSASGHSSADSTDLPTVGAVDLLVDDLDDDGYPELVFTGYNDDSSYNLDSYVYWGSASGYSTADRTDLPTTGGWESVAEDFNGDGHRDLAFCSYYSGGYSTNSTVYWGSAAGFSSADTTDLPTLGCRDLLTDDINGDGYPDLVFASYYSGSSYTSDSRIYYGSASGFSTASYDDLPTNGALSVTTGDFDGDGLTDIAFGGYFTGSWTYSAYTRVYWNSASGLSSSSYTDLGTAGVRHIESADLDGDGYDDLVAPRYYSGSSYDADSHVWWGSSSGLSDADRTDLPTTGSGHATVGDLNGDGVPEVAFTGYFGGSWASFVDDIVYWGDSSDPDVYDAADATDLDTAGTWGRIVFAGDTSW